MFENNDRLQEFFFLLGNRIGGTHKKWGYALIAAVVLSIPLFFIFRFGFYQAFYSSYQGPEIIYQPVQVEPLQVVDRKIFRLNGNIYSGFVKLRNINLERGVPEQKFVAEFKTTGGTMVSKVEGRTFVLPAQEKLIVFSRFASEREPTEIEFTLLDSRFVYEPELPPLKVEIQRVQIQNLDSEFAVSAVIKNLTPFIISQVYLPVVLYNSSNEIIGVNLTNINDLESLESRSFRVVWPNLVAGVVRAEVRAEINIFDRGIIYTGPPSQQFDVPEIDNRLF
ncbi:MAG: hypothetical protein HYW51_00350 [Candidatus Doudnabacteria bacterium]|nr:hypothetical protein [Candidatus Doudnabacteria bacterium]